MGCGYSSMKDEYEAERRREILEGFKAIASNDDLILRFAEKLDDINRQLHNFESHDLPLRRENHRQISSALSQVMELNRQIRTLKALEPLPAKFWDKKGEL